jgi:hypothetical protein
MKSQLVDVNLVIWGTREFKRNVVPLYMTQMVYTKVVLGVEMDWSNIPRSSRSQWKPNLHHKILWSIETWPNPLNGPFIASGFEQFLVPIPISVSFDAHDDEVDIDHDFLNMFENAQINQVVDPSSLHDAISNVIERWGFGLEVKHQTQRLHN